MPPSTDVATVCPDTPALLRRQQADRRGRRVVVLLIGVAALGLGDLYATYTHASSLGMHEHNPIGAYLIAANSWTGLTLYKLGTIGLAVGLLLKVRRDRSAEWAAWLLGAVMVALTLHWSQYNDHLSTQLADANYENFSRLIRPTDPMPRS